MARPKSREWPSRVNCSLTAEFALVQENILIQNERITQLYTIQAEQNPLLWFGLLFVDDGPYSGAVVRFNMYIEETYPDCLCPKIVFYPIPCHPLVNPTTGELDTKNAFPDWNSQTMKLHQLLLFVKRVIRQADEYILQIKNLIIDNSPAGGQQSNGQERRASEPLTSSTRTVEDHLLQTHNTDVIMTMGMDAEGGNHSDKCFDPTQPEDAYDADLRNMFSWFHHTLGFVNMHVNNPDEFYTRVESFKEKCYEKLLDRPALCGDDNNAIVFTPWNPEIHEPMRRCVLAGRFTPSNLFASYHKESDSVSFIPGRNFDLD